MRGRTTPATGHEPSRYEMPGPHPLDSVSGRGVPRAVRHRSPSCPFDGSAARDATGGYDGRDEGEGARPSRRFSRRSRARSTAEDVMIRTCPSGRVDPRFLIEPFEPAYLATH